MYKQGDIVKVNLNPIKGHEQGKIRPCVVCSNFNYQKRFNTIVVAPISSSEKYKAPFFEASPFFIKVPENDSVEGTILLQHLRAIDPAQRIDDSEEKLFQLPPKTQTELKRALTAFFE